MRISPTGTWNDQRRVDFASGYTLVELIVVLAVISIVVGLTMPRIRSSLSGDTLHTSVRRLVGVIKETREEAIRAHQSRYIQVDPVANRLWIHSESGDRQEEGAGQGRTIRLPEDVRIVDVWGAEHGTIAEGRVAIRISDKGYAEPTVIHLEAKGEERTVSLELQPFLGAIKVSDGYVHFSGSTDR